MAPRHSGDRGGGGNDGGMRTRIVSALLFGTVIGLLLSIGSLKMSKMQREAAAAINAAREQAAKTETSLKAELDKAGATETATAELKRQLSQVEDQLRKAEADRDAARREAGAAKASSSKAAQAAEELAKRKDEAERLKGEVAEWRDKAKAVSGGKSGEERHEPLLPSRERDELDPELAAFLRKVAVNNEVFAAMSNANYASPGGMLDTWMEGVQRAGVKNAIVIALDSVTRQNAESKGIPAHEIHVEIPKAQAGNGDNHAVSAMKFRVLRKFLRLGYSVFLSDVDIVVLQNPFKFLKRDSDIEGMTDGFDNATAYGYNDVLDDASMGWARYAHSMRVFVFNSGLFYIRSTPAAMDLLNRVVEVVENTGGWDQAIFNEAIYFPSSPQHEDVHVKRRVLDYLNFMNSKVRWAQCPHCTSENIAAGQVVTDQ
mmetsp:Transcript_13551/g.40975  ORF Transcript_13551/g.40975 Transcript_13551/m.40975 type:complete len:430 (-) Transcript_13551:85-1374(-)